MHKPTYKGRYKGIKGRYWDWLSDFIRLRDFIKYGTCITCGKKFQRWQDSQAGHFISAGNSGFALLFDPMNIHAECEYDNAFNSNHQISLRANLIGRYGTVFVAHLEGRYSEAHFGGKTTKEWGKLEYKNRLEILKKEVEKLLKKV